MRDNYGMNAMQGSQQAMVGATVGVANAKMDPHVQRPSLGALLGRADDLFAHLQKLASEARRVEGLLIGARPPMEGGQKEGPRPILSHMENLEFVLQRMNVVANDLSGSMHRLSIAVDGGRAVEDTD